MILFLYFFVDKNFIFISKVFSMKYDRSEMKWQIEDDFQKFRMKVFLFAAYKFSSNLSRYYNFLLTKNDTQSTYWWCYIRTTLNDTEGCFQSIWHWLEWIFRIKLTEKLHAWCTDSRRKIVRRNWNSNS